MTAIPDEYHARMFNALAHQRRMKIFRILLEYPDSGMRFTHLEARADMCRSSFIHHLCVMERDGFVSRKRIGPNTIYRAHLAAFASNMSDVLRLIENRLGGDRTDIAA